MANTETAELVMLDLDGGPDFVEALQRVWEAGDAVFPLDQRLPAPEAAAVIEAAAPTAVIDASGERRRLDTGRQVRSGDAVVVATSGTTGNPKAVIHTHDSVAASARITSAGLGAQPDDVWLACLPPAHIGGLSVIARALTTSSGLIAQPRFSVEGTQAALDDGATLVSLVTRALTQINADAFRRILLGGAAPPPDRPPNTVATWGMTETGSGCVYDGWPLDDVELRIVDDEIHVRGPMLLRAYRTIDGDRDPRPDDGWFRTGDLGRLEPDGRLWVDGRRGEMIVSGGEKVWPARAERILSTHPAIAEVALVGRPHPEWGHEIVAVVALSGPQQPELAELRAAVEAQLPVWYAPRDVIVVDALPRTALGKLRRADIGAATFGQ